MLLLVYRVLHEGVPDFFRPKPLELLLTPIVERSLYRFLGCCHKLWLLSVDS
jgi:hypothetical protein